VSFNVHDSGLRNFSLLISQQTNPLKPIS
jgi:hypothetical protein